jgi:hypothetical protein
VTTAWCPFDANLAADGYLRAPDGRIQLVHGLDQIMRDVVRAGVSVVWASYACDRVGWFCHRTRRIVLAPWLFWCPGWFVRDVISHEFAHGVVRGPEETVRAWQRRTYGELVDVPAWM